MAPITETQEIVLTLITFVPSIASIFGSSTIVYLTTHQTQKRNVYSRLLLAMSVMDVIATTSWLFQPFLIPKSGGRVWAIGNDETCQALGFFSQLTSSVTIYNAYLAGYFWLTIVWGYGDEFVHNWFEPLMHAASLGYPFITALVGVGFGMFSGTQLGLACYIGDWPLGCRDDPDAFCWSQPLSWVFTGIPYLSSILFMALANTAIYCKVRKTLRKSGGYERRSTMISGSIMSSSVTTTPSSDERRIRDVGIQSFLYVAASINTVVWMVALRMVEGQAGGPTSREDEAGVYWLVVIVQLSYPSQGFFNALIFARPKYLRWRRREPDKSRCWCLRQALTPADHHRQHSHAMTHASYAAGTSTAVIVQQRQEQGIEGREIDIDDDQPQEINLGSTSTLAVVKVSV